MFFICCFFAQNGKLGIRIRDFPWPGNAAVGIQRIKWDGVGLPVKLRSIVACGFELYIYSPVVPFIKAV